MREKTSDTADRGYKRILKSTFIMGSSSIINTILGIVRTKIIAMILGPSGVGVTGIYTTITHLVSTMSGMGIRESGVRQIAGAFATGDQLIISRTITSMRRAAFFCGVGGLCVLLFFSGIISRATFGDAGRSWDLAILSTTVLFGAVSGAQTALIQGMQRIGDLARLSMLSALFGTLFSIPIIYFVGEGGIALYLAIVSFTGVLTSWWYSRKIEIAPVKLEWRESLFVAKPLLKLGAALMIGSLMAPCTQYLLRVLVVHQGGLSAAGVYHASTILSVIYVKVILDAMLTGYYPRLSAVAHDNDECRSLTNGQVEVGLLLAMPGILAIMTFAPLVITLFYSSRFLPAVDVLRWQILGVVLQVVTWPMGFMLRAKGDGILFIWTELFANGIHLGLALAGMIYFGLAGIGMAFLGMSLSYWGLIYCIVRKKYGFAFTEVNLRIMGFSAIAATAVFLTPRLMEKNLSLAFNAGIAAAAALYSIRAICSRSATEATPGILLKIKTRFNM